jgi:hypothetical protein
MPRSKMKTIPIDMLLLDFIETPMNEGRFRNIIIVQFLVQFLRDCIHEKLSRSKAEIASLKRRATVGSG